MKGYRSIIIVVYSIAIALSVLIVPWKVDLQRGEYSGKISRGYHLLFSKPLPIATVDYGVITLEIIALTAIAVLIYFLLNKNGAEVPPSNTESSAAPVKNYGKKVLAKTGRVIYIVTIVFIALIAVGFAKLIGRQLGKEVANYTFSTSNQNTRPAFKSVDEELAYLNANQQTARPNDDRPPFTDPFKDQQTPSASPEASRDPERDVYVQQLDRLIGDGTPAVRIQTVKDPAFATFLSLKDRNTGRLIRDIAEAADRNNDAVLMSQVYKAFFIWNSSSQR